MFGKGFGASRRRNGSAKVMLTSMMDMFTIILVFLLYNFNADDQHFKPSADLELPASNAELKLKDAVNVMISPTEIRVDKKVVARIRKGRVVGTRVRGMKIVSLYKELRRHRAVLEYKIRKGKLQEEDQSVVLLQADKSIPYHIVDKVLKSSGMAGFPKFRFAVFRRES